MLLVVIDNEVVSHLKEPRCHLPDGVLQHTHRANELVERILHDVISIFAVAHPTPHERAKPGRLLLDDVIKFLTFHLTLFQELHLCASQ